MKPPYPKHQPEVFWPKVVVRKWLNISAKESDYSADTEDDDSIATSDSDTDDSSPRGRHSRLKSRLGSGVQVDFSDTFPRGKRHISETFRTQYINVKELKVCAGTWNVGGKVPPEDLEIDDWVDMQDPADIYVFGLQEVVPLNAGNIFGAEDNRPALKWEKAFRESFDRIRCRKPNIKSYSDPPSPSRFKPSEGMTGLEDEMEYETESGSDEEVHPVDEAYSVYENKVDSDVQDATSMDSIYSRILGPGGSNLQRQFALTKTQSRLSYLQTEEDAGKSEPSAVKPNRSLTKQLSGTEMIGLSWPEPPLDLLGQHVERSKSFKLLKTSKSFKKYNSFKSTTGHGGQSDIVLLEGIDLELLMYQKRRSHYVRIVSKQMVGILLTIWVRRSLRRHIQNVKVSTVGVGAMGYIGNKGSVSVSMSVYQTLFCFICTHLTSGERELDQLKRNADVHEIKKRTEFHSVSKVGLPKKILDHERIIWLGDLNYRLNVPHGEARELISRGEWSKLVEKDQLVREFLRGRAFDGWNEGILTFPPTYKYELNSDKYIKDDLKGGRRTPAWCDRILSYGKGMRLIDYRRAELKLSDHRPVTATYIVEVEVFSPRRLQQALAFTEAEVENHVDIENMVTEVGISQLRLGEVISDGSRLLRPTDI